LALLATQILQQFPQSQETLRSGFGIWNLELAVAVGRFWKYEEGLICVPAAAKRRRVDFEFAFEFEFYFRVFPIPEPAVGQQACT